MSKGSARDGLPNKSVPRLPCRRSSVGLLVPTSAVIRTGERDIAFRLESGDRFVPVEVKISAWKFGERFHVLKGLKAGDKVVTSANFLID